MPGLIGLGIQKSRTPLLHECEGDAQGLRVLYRLIDLEPLGRALPDLVLAAERMGFTGLDVSYPCKQGILLLQHGIAPNAALTGAVNTIVLHGGKATKAQYPDSRPRCVRSLADSATDAVWMKKSSH